MAAYECRLLKMVEITNSDFLALLPSVPVRGELLTPADLELGVLFWVSPPVCCCSWLLFSWRMFPSKGFQQPEPAPSLPDQGSPESRVRNIHSANGTRQLHIKGGGSEGLKNGAFWS